MEETEKDKCYRINNIVFCQLLPVADNMITFEVDKDIITNIINGFSKQYNLPEDLNNHLAKIVEDNLKSLNNLEKRNVENKMDESFKCNKSEDSLKIEDKEIISSKSLINFNAKNNVEVLDNSKLKRNSFNLFNRKKDF